MSRVHEISLRWKRIVLYTGFVWLFGCTGAPSEAQLEAWRQEALEADRLATLAADEAVQQENASETRELHLSGGREPGGSVSLSWEELHGLPQTDVHTISPHQTSIKGTVYHYRGVAVRDLLTHHSVSENAEKITFVAYDGFRSTVSVQDLKDYPIIVATERNGRPIPRGEGGPLLLVFPYSDHPELAARYLDRWWVFYVNHLIVDTPPIELDVVGTRVDRATFDSLPTGQLWVTGRYKVNWPASQVLLKGVFLRDLLHHAGVRLEPGEKVVLSGMAPIHHDASRPMLVSSEQIERCDVLVASHKGSEAEPITSEYGGPLVMAYSPECSEELEDRSWIVHLKSIARAE